MNAPSIVGQSWSSWSNVPFGWCSVALLYRCGDLWYWLSEGKWVVSTLSARAVATQVDVHSTNIFCSAAMCEEVDLSAVRDPELNGFIDCKPKTHSYLEFPMLQKLLLLPVWWQEGCGGRMYTFWISRRAKHCYYLSTMYHNGKHNQPCKLWNV